MTFHESYGSLPKKTLTLVKRHNVSPSDFDLMTDILGNGSWDDVNEHITRPENQLGGGKCYTGRVF